MLVTPIPHGLDLLKSDLVRSTGVHASDIYGSLFKTLDPKRYDYGDELPRGELMALGTAWESHFEKLLVLNGIIAYRPPELMSPEGIAYSPDLLIEKDGILRVGEIKLTSMSPDDFPTIPGNSFPPKLDKYLAQMKLYAFWLTLMDGWLAILSIRKPYAPELRIFEIAWTERELADNHKMMINHATHEGLI